MSSSDRRVAVSLATPQGPLQLRLYDPTNTKIATGFGRLEQNLRPGLYRLVVDGGSVVHERFLAVGSKGLTDHQIAVVLPSAAPVAGAATTHEFHSGPAALLSRCPRGNAGTGGRVLVFVRNMTGSQRGAVDVSGLSLLDAGNRQVLSGRSDFTSDLSFGWSGQSMDVAPGGYILRQHLPAGSDSGSERSIDQSIWIEPGWTTLVFIPFRDEIGRPEPEFASIHMCRVSDGFYPYADGGANLALEVALSGLRTGRALVPPQLEDLLLGGKFQNPMLGIVGALGLLHAASVDWKLFATVRRNLQKLVPSHPDVHALQVMEKGARNDAADTRIPSVGWPPMLRVCYAALIERDAQEKRRIVAEDSVADLAAARLLASGPWTRWRSIESGVAALSESAKKAFAEAIQGIGTMLLDLGVGTAVPSLASSLPARKERGRPAAVAPAAGGFVKMAAPGTELVALPEALRVADYLGNLNSIVQARAEGIDVQRPDLRTISEGTGLPSVAVRRGLSTLAKLAKEEKIG